MCIMYYLLCLFFVSLLRRPPSSPLTYTLFPYTTLFRSFFERGLVGNEGQLMRDEQIEHLGHGVECRFAALGDALLTVEPRAEPLVQFMAGFALEPSAQCIGQDRGFGRAALRFQVRERLRQVIGAVKLMAGLEWLTRTNQIG